MCVSNVVYFVFASPLDSATFLRTACVEYCVSVLSMILFVAGSECCTLLRLNQRYDDGLLRFDQHGDT